MSNKILLRTLIILIRACGLLIIWIIGKDAKIKIVIVYYISVSDSLLFHLIIPEGRGRGIGHLVIKSHQDIKAVLTHMQHPPGDTCTAEVLWFRLCFLSN